MNVLSSLNENSTYIVRILIATLCGFIIGFERANKNKDAGIRTHCIVALGSCLCMIVSAYAFPSVYKSDPARMAAQVVSGVGFLGAGLIFVRRDRIISGLTTAAGIWTTAIIGLAIGSGMIFIGFFSTLIMLLIQIPISKFIQFLPYFGEQNISIIADSKTFNFNDLLEYLDALEIEPLSIGSEKLDNYEYNFLLFVNIPKNVNLWTLSENILKLNGVKSVKV
ncbi:MgtC/SapB family protein [Anaerosphaera multitolerans]|uniref:MgtC/SapB family protein n=1 Tax=Anaerosphaera multitolerans TaxID=2487351 RepID=A0A437S5I1_9FIRM|nr:MgtC/SapB family protein [Anaerosphaera multitolerans]RVU54271.1 MgtC/SapB family protein [Anaerosphaera multitolerans]